MVMSKLSSGLTAMGIPETLFLVGVLSGSTFFLSGLNCALASFFFFLFFFFSFLFFFFSFFLRCINLSFGY